MASQHTDLFEFVNRGNVDCLNASPEHPASNLFLGAGSKTAGTVLCSDVDEELLITVPFREKVKVYAIEFTAPNDGRKPSHVKVFMNAANLGFEDCEEAIPAQEAELSWTPAGDEQKAILHTRFVKFQNVDSISLYITSNTEDAPVTCLSGLTFLGQPMGSTAVWDPSQQQPGM
ncbi:Thioredoxin-like protein 1 [Diplonema papillatum]|nr:Thioredoxin-like protein 1 [Diplonema papillatum]